MTMINLYISCSATGHTIRYTDNEEGREAYNKLRMALGVSTVIDLETPGGMVAFDMKKVENLALIDFDRKFDNDVELARADMEWSDRFDRAVEKVKAGFQQGQKP